VRLRKSLSGGMPQILHRRRPALMVPAAVIAATALVASAYGSSNRNSGTISTSKAPIAIGNIGEYSGSQGAQNTSAQLTLRAWVKWTNRHGGLNGHPVKLYFVDPQFSSTNALAGIKDLVENKHIVALVGDQDFSLGAYQAYIDAAGVPVIGPANTVPAIVNGDPNFFPINIDAAGNVYSLLRTVQKAGYRKLGIMYCVEAPICKESMPIFKTYAEKVGVDFKLDLPVSSSAPNYAAVCLQMKQADVTALYFHLNATASARVATDCVAQGYKPQFFLSDGLDETFAGFPALEGAFGTWHAFLPFAHTRATATFDAAIKSFTGKYPYGPGRVKLRYSGPLAWEAAALLKAAVAHVKGVPTARKIKEGLYSLKNETLGGLVGPLNYKRGRPHASLTCYWIVRLRNGQLRAPYGTKHTCPKLPAT
jgi:branched-chain amino acid transport system substrate-binding protein